MKMEDPHSHDLYFSLPDLVNDSYSKDFYFSWEDLVGKSYPEELYFSWEDIIGYLDNPHSKEDAHLHTPSGANLTPFNKGVYKTSASSIAGDSQWDDTESNLSLDLSSIADSQYSNTSESANEIWAKDIEDQIPPYGDQAVERCSDTIPSILTFTAAEPTPHPLSSFGFSKAPIYRPLHENHLSYKWSLEEIIESRKHVKYTLHKGSEKSRLENGLWRAWGKRPTDVDRNHRGARIDRGIHLSHKTERLQHCHQNCLHGLIEGEHQGFEPRAAFQGGYHPSSPLDVFQTQKSSTSANALLQCSISSCSCSKQPEMDAQQSETEKNVESVCGEPQAIEFAVDTKAVVAEVLDPMRVTLVDRVMEEFWVMFNQGWTSNNNQHAGNSTGTSQSSGVENTNCDADARQSYPRKRQRGDEDPGDQSGDRNSQPPGKKTSKGEDPEEIVKFACPFRKHNSRKYNIYSHRSCTLSHWDTIARVKEHLYRCHQIEIHCKRCWRTFKNQQQLDAHLTVASANICSLIPGHPPDGITPENEKRLKSRKKIHPNQSDDSRWAEIYKLLFPNEEVPSPYFEPVLEEAPLSPDSQNLANYEEYSRRELPLMVRGAIEDAIRREMQPFGDSLIGNLVGIIQDCQDRIFRAYREGTDSKGDMRLPPSIDSDDLESPQSHPPAEDQTHPDPRVQEEPDFLAALFNHPPSIQDPGIYFAPFEANNQVPTLPTNNVFSDSGYSSEMLCTSPGSRSGFATTISSASDGIAVQRATEADELFQWQAESQDWIQAPEWDANGEDYFVFGP